jgi:hypothetical protein
MDATPRVDITVAVRALLPPALGQRLAEVERVLRAPVRFVRDDALREAGGAAQLDGVIRLAPRNVANLDVIGEELMHLHRWMHGFPFIEPLAVASLEGYAGGLQVLAGCFDEHAFFPSLEALGLAPRTELTRRLAETVALLEGRLDEIAMNGPTVRWRVILSVIHAQAALLAPDSPARTALLEMYDRAPLHAYVQTAVSLRNEIAGVQAAPPPDVEAAMRTCLRVLQVPAPAARVGVRR